MLATTAYTSILFVSADAFVVILIDRAAVMVSTSLNTGIHWMRVHSGRTELHVCRMQKGLTTDQLVCSLLIHFKGVCKLTAVFVY